MSISNPRTTFYRPVRNYPEPLPKETFQIESPPQVPQKASGTMALTQFLYPLTGILTTLVMVLTTTSNSHASLGSQLPQIGAELAIVPFSIGLMFLSNMIQRRGARKSLQAERASYKSYLESVQRRLAEVAKLQVQYNQRLYPEPRSLPAIVAQRQLLWERRPAARDFLHVRIGTAPMALCCEISFQEDYKANYVSDLLQAARDIVTQQSYIDAQPLTISLGSLGVLSVAGPHAESSAFVRSILAQIIAFHAPGEVRILACFPPPTSQEWDWLKWTPHTRLLRPIKKMRPTDPEPYCMLASTTDDLQRLLDTQVKPELERRQKFKKEKLASQSETARNQHIPHLVLLLDYFSHSGTLARVPGLEELMVSGTQVGITVICLVTSQEHEPATTRARLKLTPLMEHHQLSYKETTPEGREIEFITPDAIDTTVCQSMARMLTPLQLIDREAEIDFAQDIGLLALHAIPSVEQLEMAQYWQRRDEKQLLRVPIGIQKNGPLLLDLKEMAAGGYGPHGLVVGATGSGKSELLRTAVISLALTHDPLTLNLVLVDFKAGAAFADLESLPHVAGVITNLENDPQAINRMYASLLGEQQRRQNMLSRAGNLANIRQYQAKWRRDPEGMEPMPYLLIIVDEFAQLIASYEDFLALFVKLGQVGRSLGMHMMLATQRVDEGRIQALEGHLRYRICLRTFRPEESSSVIGTPDAYYLPPAPGSGYFKVDEDIYTAFKTALISTPYVPPEKQQVNPLDLICIFNSTGQFLPYQTANTVPRKEEEEETVSEMSVVVERIGRTPAPAKGWRVHFVWQPPLGTAIPLGYVLGRYGANGQRKLLPGSLCVPIGMLDRPAEQIQSPAEIDFSGVGGHLAVVGAPQSGKSTFLRTLLASFMLTHTPREVQIYGIDFGGGLLRIFEGAPHVGAICGRADREKMRRVLRRLTQLVADREMLFVEREIDSMSVYRQMRRQGKLEDQEFGDVFLVVDNFGQVQVDLESSDADSIEDIIALIANGLTYGVHVVLATNLWSEIRMRLRSNIGTRLELRLNDPTDSDIDPRLAAMIPAGTPGRGLHPSKWFFQTALPLIKSASDSAFSMQQELEQLIQGARQSWQGSVAPPIRVLPSEVRWQDLVIVKGQEPLGVPVGLEELRLDPLYIDLVGDDPHMLILGDRECGKTTLLRAWMRGIERRYTPEQARIVLIDYRKKLLEFSRSEHLLTYAVTPEQVEEAVRLLKEELEQRLKQSLQQPLDLMSEPQPWDGLHYYIFADDYEIVATQSPQNSNPLNPLESLMQSGHDIGLHVVLARRVTELSRSSYDPIFRSIRNMECPGLLMRGDPAEGRQALHKQNVSGVLPTGRARYVRRSVAPLMVQIVRAE